MKYLLLLALLGCRSPMPDEIGYTLGHGESDFNNTARTGMDTTYGSVTITYHLGKDSPPPAPTYDHAYEEWLWQSKFSPTTKPASIQAPSVEPPAIQSSEPIPEQKPFDPKPFIPYLPGLLLAACAAAFGKKEH